MPVSLCSCQKCAPETVAQLAAERDARWQTEAELKLYLAKCGKENCMGWDASWPDHPGSIAQWVRKERLLVAEASLTRCREALQRYGQHNEPCTYWKTPAELWDAMGKAEQERNCSCGFEAALAATSGEPQP